MAAAALSGWLALQPAYADDAPSARVGINRVNLGWLSRSEQERILKDIAASGATDVRLSLSRPVDQSIEALAIASGLGLRILLEIQLGNKSYYRESARPRTGFGRIWDIYRLSDLDLGRYRKGLREALQRIDALGIRLEAIEPGNEINHAGYNGDLAVYPKPGAPTPRSIADLKDRLAFERGLDNYVRVLEISRDEVRATVHSRNATVVSAGFSDMSAEEADKRGVERLDPREFVAALHHRGADSFIDAYGIHIYPGRKAAGALATRVNGLLDFCRAYGQGKPCWVTEWGIANPARSCPVDDRAREGAVRAMRAAFGELMKEGRLAAAYYYDWDTQPSYSLWRCGKLSPAGAAAIRPAEIEGARAR
ncbi:glycoside hydrolase family protein [Sinorhizobium garamanticum]|uniref:Glycoside hydrolase family protein n=1 Tax=Sinorhizobium garamanticum TaxID=680247 RepID=A0ABY8DP34_9HYPH|nr:glycoside hydrolase [Sinorhizobium garamanticum]WEX90701.1 glycoside hydrolase family protein [Sinorhizobium garamanticum]